MDLNLNGEAKPGELETEFFFSLEWNKMASLVDAIYLAKVQITSRKGDAIVQGIVKKIGLLSARGSEVSCTILNDPDFKVKKNVTTGLINSSGYVGKCLMQIMRPGIDITINAKSKGCGSPDGRDIANIRLSPEDFDKIQNIAQASGTSLETVVQDAIEKQVGGKSEGVGS